MAFSPQKFREIVFQLLFSLDMGDSKEEDLVPFLMRELSITKRIVRSALDKARQIWDQRLFLDEKIEKISKDYALERIGRVERNVLRLGTFELLTKELAPEIIIAEAIRLSRKFSTPESAFFVNAVIDKYYKEHASVSS